MYPRNHHLIPQKLPHSKLQRKIQDILAKESGVIFFKKKRSPLSISSANYGVQINSNGKPSIPSTPYPPKNPMFHETWIWLSTNPDLDHPSSKQYR
jgi:hypothetical protein